MFSHLICGHNIVFFGHNIMVFGTTIMVFEFLVLSIHQFVLLAMVFVYVAHKTHNMKNFWSLAIQNSSSFVMSTMYAHGWHHGWWPPPHGPCHPPNCISYERIFSCLCMWPDMSCPRIGKHDCICILKGF